MKKKHISKRPTTKNMKSRGIITRIGQSADTVDKSMGTTLVKPKKKSACS